MTIKPTIVLIGLEDIIETNFLLMMIDCNVVYFNDVSLALTSFKSGSLVPDYLFIHDFLCDDFSFELLQLVRLNRVKPCLFILITDHDYDTIPLYFDYIFKLPLDFEAVYRRLFCF